VAAMVASVPYQKGSSGTLYAPGHDLFTI